MRDRGTPKISKRGSHKVFRGAEQVKRSMGLNFLFQHDDNALRSELERVSISGLWTEDREKILTDECRIKNHVEVVRQLQFCHHPEKSGFPSLYYGHELKRGDLIF